MGNFDNIVEEETKKHNPNWQQIPDHRYRILILFGDSGSGKSNSIFNLISQQLHIGKRTIWMIFIKTLKSTTQIKKVNC